MNEQQQTEIYDTLKTYGKRLILGLVLAVTVMNSYNYNPGGVNSRVKQPGIGASVEGELPSGVRWIKEEGFYFKIPFLSRVSEFNKNGTIASTNNEDLMDNASSVIPPMTAPFADAFQMEFEWSVRYRIAMDDIGLEAMYQELKSQEALLANTVMPFAQTLFTDSVNQMLGGDFAQGGKNSLRTLIDNQSQFGMYQTKVVKEVKSRNSGKGSNSVLGGASTDVEVTTVEYLTDAQNKLLRTPLSIEQYGIKIVPNSFQIIENRAVGRLITYIDNKQRNLELQIKQDEDQKLLVKQAKTEQLKGEKDLVTKTNKLNIQKQEAIIAGERRVAEAELAAKKEVVERQKVADLAIIDKTRQLQESKANEGIQKANAIAAKHEGAAIKEVGFAEAAVTQAKYKAIDKDILKLEVDKATALALYQSNMQVQMPLIMNSGAGGVADASGSIADMSNIKILEMLGTPVSARSVK